MNQNQIASLDLNISTFGIMQVVMTLHRLILARSFKSLLFVGGFVLFLLN